MSDFTLSQELQNVNSPQADEQGLCLYAVLPLRAAVVFPDVITPLAVSTTMSQTVINTAFQQNTTVLGVALRDLMRPETDPKNLYAIGTELALSRPVRLSETTTSVLAQGRQRLEIVSIVQQEPFMLAQARLVPEIVEDTAELEALAQAILNLFRRVVELNTAIPEDVLDLVLETLEPVRLSNLVTATLTLPVTERQRVLEMSTVKERLQHIAMLLGRELSVLELQDEINHQTQQEIDREQRELYLREQMKVIQTELGEEDFFQQEINEVREQIIAANLPAPIHEKAMKELARLQVMPPMAPEIGIIRTYIDWITGLPWGAQREDNLDVKHAQQILDAEHYGLPKAKERILEHIAVRKLAADKMKTPILCFVGPPGVGKTSLGHSIANALGREFVRVSLGGVHDEAEIRGHRRTYIGALPGRILQTMRGAETINPVFMLDEIDKLGKDFRGDPASALLEVLDPEQNNEYVDHYLDMPYDLSKVLFITTANDLSPLPDALLDRMEVIEFPGYTEEEKLDIARKFLLPRQLEENGLADMKIKFEANALQVIISSYTYEAGVRNLNREIATVCRKIARLIAEEKPFPKRITNKQVEKFLGPPPYLHMRANDQDAIGVATGMAWTSAGGDIMTIEVSIMPGKGNLLLTGQLGDVMQESAQAALSYLRSRATAMDIPHDDFENYDVHVHLPEGAVPKDGPSAGITLAAAIISAFTERKVRSAYAMTGEITLRGKVLPVGGIKEKLLAARRARIPQVILPKENQKDLVELPKKALRDLAITFVEDMQQVIDLVLLEPPPEGRQRDLERQQDDDEEDEETAVEAVVETKKAKKAK